MYPFISEIIDSSGELIETKIDLDFSRLQFIEPTGVTVLSNTIELAKKSGSDINFSNYSTSVDAINYLDDSLFFERYTGKPLKGGAHLRSTTAQLTLVSHKNSFSWIESDLIPWISDIVGTKKTSLASIKVCFQEIFNNIKDHSSEDIGCIFGQHYPKKKELQIAISDFGVGIPSNVQKIDPKLSDGECIKLASQEGFTTRTGKNNRGAGLDILIKNVVQNNGGSLIIHSGSGILSCTQEGRKAKKTARTSSGHYPGTLLQATFKTDQFFYFEDQDEDEVFEW
ncbi:hypothetical protein ACNKW1_13470 [Thauera sp. WH-2]|uniref:hypothetical protein n=1 Tax=Thauera sp. WH-2 TaxID=3401574 RepID=UPI003AAFE896